MNDKTTLSLLEKIKQINFSYDKIAQKTGGNYNIFNVLGLESNEVKHSMLIGDLLSPKGFHGQGTHFLDFFLEQINENKTPFELDSTSTVVEVEKDVGVINDDKTCGGRLDIYLADKKGNCIIIENKIYATDQEKQLVRYYNYGKSLKKPYKLIYLNLSGEEPSKYSVLKGNNKKDVLVKDKDFTILNYKDFILPWLKKCLAISTHKPYIREILTQYISIINNLTGQPNNPEMSEDIVEELVKSKDSLKAAFEIKKHLTEAKIEIQTKFWENLKTAFESKGFHFENIKGNEKEFVEKEFIKEYYSKNEKYYGIVLKNKELTAKNIYFKIELDHNVYYGFKSFNKQVDNHQKFIKKLTSSGYKNADNFLGWIHTSPKINFKNFERENNIAIDLADESFRKKIVDKIIKDCLLIIETLPKD